MKLESGDQVASVDAIPASVGDIDADEAEAAAEAAEDDD